MEYDEHHFEGYWVRLMALVRQNEAADEILDQMVISPVNIIANLPNGQLKAAWVNAYNTLDLPYPTKESAELDPIGSIRQLIAAGKEEVATQQWVATHIDEIKKYRKGIKFIYQTCVATLSIQQATEIVGDLPYGSGLQLLERVKAKQHRQTSMSLFVLFDNILGMKLKPKETLAALFARITALRRRLLNWSPPIRLPEQLILVCILRALPAKYASTCTIIMATRNIDLSTAKIMLLDAENADANLINRNLGSGAPAGTTPVGNALTTKDIKKIDKKKKKQRKYFTKAYFEEGCCPECPDGGHAKSECYKLHPELKPQKKHVGSASVGTPKSEEEERSTDLYGFLTSTCLIGCRHGCSAHEVAMQRNCPSPKRLLHESQSPSHEPIDSQSSLSTTQFKKQPGAEHQSPSGDSNFKFTNLKISTDDSNFKFTNLKISKQKSRTDKTQFAALSGSQARDTQQGVVIDSGACSHVTNCRKQLVSMQSAKLSGIQDLSGQISKVEGMGNLQNGKLVDVLYVPKSQHNLMSVGALLDQVNGRVVFTRTKVQLETKGHCTVIGQRTHCEASESDLHGS